MPLWLLTKKSSAATLEARARQSGKFIMLIRAALPRIQDTTRHTASPLDILLDELDETWQQADNPLRCVSCGNPVTTHNQHFSRGGQSAFHFVNPDGYQFDICLYRNALGCYQAGEASDQHTWFPPSSWQHALCDQCDLHLGWFYQSDDGDNFWGLISALLTSSA